MGQLLVPFPHMALNSHDVPPPDYLMFNTWKVAAGIPVSHIIDHVKNIANNCPGKQLATLIFNAHGSPGKIHIGQGINLSDLPDFQVWNTGKPLIKEIWIIACNVAGKQKNVSGGVDGESFLRDFAIATGSTVTGAVRQQRPEESKLPVGFVDDWEGEVQSYDKYGKKTIRQEENASHVEEGE